MLEARTPRFTEHALEDTDDLGADVGFACWVGEFKRVESDRVSGVGGVEIDNVFNAGFGDEAKIIDGKVAVRIDDAVALIIENVREGEKLKKAGFTSAGLTDDIDVAGAVTAEETKLVIDTAEIGETKGGDVFVFGGIASEDGELGGGLGGLRCSPDDIRRLYGSVREVVDGGEFGDVQDEAVVGELAEFVAVEGGGLEGGAFDFETVEVGGVELFEGTDEGLHVELGIDFVGAEVGETNLDFVAELGGLFFGFGDASLVAFGDFYGL